ncbi:MAG: 7-cyano-7-deazaguanine synthase, partial [Candidatus Omnitrophota bacterium]
MKKGVILLSGGIDSVTTLYLAKKRGYNLVALIFDYNQRHRKEIECARKIAAINKVKCFLEKIDLGWAKSSLTNRNKTVPSQRRLTGKELPST